MMLQTDMLRTFRIITSQISLILKYYTCTSMLLKTKKVRYLKRSVKFHLVIFGRYTDLVKKLIYKNIKKRKKNNQKVKKYMWKRKFC